MKITQKQNKAIAERTSKSIRMLFAEHFDELLADHRKTCTDPKCDESQIAMSFQGEVITPMVRVGSPKEVFLTIESTPFQSIQLATGDEIKQFFNEDGTAVLPCQCGECDGSHGPQDVAFLHAACHLRHSIALVPLSNGQVSLVCKTCGKGVLGPLQVAPRPKVEHPFLFCDYHGKQHGYLICKHVLEGKQPKILERATDTDSGTAICTDRCARLLNVPLEEFKQKHRDKFGPICAGHLNDCLNGKLEQLLVEAEAEWHSYVLLQRASLT